MRTRFGWLIVFAVITLLFSGCNSLDFNNDDDSNWSDSFLKQMYIGSVPVQADETVNVSLSNTYKLRFELCRPVTNASLNQLLDFEFWIINMDTSQSFLITEGNMNANGQLVFLGDDNTVVEFRYDHDMSFFYSGGQKVEVGSPGQTFKIKLAFLVGQAQDGSQFALMEDEFFIVWTGG